MRKGLTVDLPAPVQYGQLDVESEWLNRYSNRYLVKGKLLQIVGVKGATRTEPFYAKANLLIY
jgi:hypothetical protein